jgi:hypothetical protein
MSSSSAASLSLLLLLLVFLISLPTLAVVLLLDSLCSVGSKLCKFLLERSLVVVGAAGHILESCDVDFAFFACLLGGLLLRSGLLELLLAILGVINALLALDRSFESCAFSHVCDLWL